MTAPLRVLQVVDSLAAGGTERMAVRLANGLTDRVELSALCATRLGGPLRSEIDPSVEYLDLGRRSIVDLRAARVLRRFIRDRGISVVHAHSSSVFFVAAALAPRSGQPKLVLHEHNSRLGERRRWVTRTAGRLSDAVFAVSDDIAAWNRRAGVPAGKISVLANFADAPDGPTSTLELPGHPGSRLVVVANLRPEKNHLRLIRAFAKVVAAEPDAHLLVVGSLANVDHATRVRSEIEQAGLVDHVTLLGVRSDVPAVLAGCDLAILPSIDEGLPLALIEYGFAGLAVVASPVGQIPEVTDQGASAVLVDPLDEQAIATALVDLLGDDARRTELGRRLSVAVRARYSAAAVLPEIIERYGQLLGAAPGHGTTHG